MMEYEKILRLPVYGLTQDEKESVFGDYLTALTNHHGKNCVRYARFLQKMNWDPGITHHVEDIPFLPVRIFKDLDLCSVPEDQVFKTMTSSGTTGQKTSRIYLDKRTASNQQKTLANIVSRYIGSSRVPMLIIDTQSVIKDRQMFSARGAGILGFSIFGSQRLYALDDDMNLKLDEIEEFLDRHCGKPILVFGFTYMIWKFMFKELVRQNRRLNIPQGIMIHGGGWKKLQHEAVGSVEFRQCIKQVSGIEHIHNYYGMVEQTGCIYMECEYGHLHTSSYSDVIIRNAEDFSACKMGAEGMIQVLSLLPESYPGHSILTEDRGVLLGTDSCPCGRKGNYFKVLGRVRHAEIRGCSDTFTKGG